MWGTVFSTQRRPCWGWVPLPVLLQRHDDKMLKEEQTSQQSRVRGMLPYLENIRRCRLLLCQNLCSKRIMTRIEHPQMRVLCGVVFV
jgi:hypothetical protein